MRIEKTAWLYPAPVALPLSAVTAPPTADGPEIMSSDCRPAVDVLPKRNFRDFIHLQMLRGDMAGSMAVINGGELGVDIRRAVCFAMYGTHAPKITVHPLRLDDTGIVSVAESIPDALPHRNSALLLIASTDDETPAGKYRTDLEIQCEGGVYYMPVVIDVADAAVVPVDTVPATASAASALDILFSAAREGAFPLAEGEDYSGMLYRLAYHDRMLYEAARSVDRLLTDTLCGCLCDVRTHHDDDAALLTRVRRALVYCMDDRFDAGNRATTMPKGGVSV